MQKSMVQALGSQKWLTLTQHSSTNSCLQELESQGYRVIASDLSATSKPVGEIPWSQGCTESSNTVDDYCKNLAPANEDENVKVAIVMGSEKTGISSTMRMQANELFYLPMKGFAESFNLAAATAITCAHLDAMHLLKPSLPVPMKRRILLTWLTRSVDGSMPLLRKAGLNVGTNRKPPYAVICGVNAKP
jgi:tRNA (guanosine-2'-O-)-methyltransferase